MTSKPVPRLPNRFISAQCPPSPTLNTLREADLRAWLAAERAPMAAATRTRARHLSAVRSFFRFLARRHGVHHATVAAKLIGAPKIPPTFAQARLSPDQATGGGAKILVRPRATTDATLCTQARAIPRCSPYYTAAGLRICRGAEPHCGAMRRPPWRGRCAWYRQGQQAAPGSGAAGEVAACMASRGCLPCTRHRREPRRTFVHPVSAAAR